MILAGDFFDFLGLLNRHGVCYMVIGGYALAFHEKPRYTGDMNIWIEVSEPNADKLLSVIKDFGFQSLGFTKNDFLQQGFITQIGRPPLRIDILNNMDGVEFEDAAKDAREININGLVVPYIGVAHFIQNKEATGRMKDLADIQEIKKAPRSRKK